MATSLVRKAVPADNNCLFSALAHLASSDDSPATLRTTVADATLAHADHAIQLRLRLQSDQPHLHAHREMDGDGGR